MTLPHGHISHAGDAALSSVPLNHALRAVLPHAAKSNARTPLLESVHLTPERAAATDRFTAAFANLDPKLKLVGVPVEGVVIPAGIAAVLAKVKERITRLELEDVDGLTRITATTVTGSQLVDIARLETGCLRIDRLVRSAAEDNEKSENPRAGLKPHDLAKFATRHLGGGKYDYVTVTLGSTDSKPLTVTYGGWFTALDMPGSR